MSLGYPAFEPLIQVADVTGAAYAGAKANFYVAGSSTRANTYTTRTVGSAGTPNANPVEADANGRFPAIFLDPDVIYKVDITNSADVSIPRYPIDNVQVEVKPTQIDIGTTLWPRTQAEIDASVTPANLFHQPGWVERYLTNSSPGTTDMAAGFTNAFKQAKETDGATARGNDTYKLGSTVNCRASKVDLTGATINIAHTGIGIIAGGNRSSATNPVQRLGTVLRTTGTDSATNPTIKIMGAQGQEIHVVKSGWIQLYADSNTQADGIAAEASAYGTFHLNYCRTLEINNNPSPSDGSILQWINENRFYLGRCWHFIMNSGSYVHNHNTFYGGNFEYDTDLSTPASIAITIGHSNTFNDTRFEFSGTAVEITFGDLAHDNRIFQGWTSSLSDYTSEVIYGNSAFNKITDTGANNQVLKTSSMSKQTFVIAHASIDDPIFDTTVGQTFDQHASITTSPADLKPSLFSLQAVGSNDYIMSTDLFRVKRGDIIGWNTETFSSVSPGYRSYFYCYDEDGAPVLPVKHVSGGAQWANGKNYYSGQLNTIDTTFKYAGPVANQAAQELAILGPEIAFIKIVWLSGSAAATTNTARSITAYIRRGMSMATENITSACVPDVKQKFLGVSGVPTQGFAKVGYSVCDIDGSHHVVDRSVDTTLASGASSGATTVVLTDATGIAAGDVIGILNDAELVTDWRTVNSAAGTPSITLTGGGLTGAAAAGNRVVFLNWISE